MSAFTLNQYPVAPQKRIEAGGRHKAPSRLTRFLGRIGAGLKGNSTETASDVTEQTAPVLTRESQMIAAEAAQIETTSPVEIIRRREVMRKLTDERLPKAETVTTEPMQEVSTESDSQGLAAVTSVALPQRVRNKPTAFGQLGSEASAAEETYVPKYSAEYSAEEPVLAGRHRAIVHRLGRHALDIPAIDANQVHEAALPADLYEPKHRA